MTDKRISDLQILADPNGRDLLLVIDVPTAGTKVQKKITLHGFFGNVPVNTAITGTLVVSGNSTHNGANNYFQYHVNVGGVLTTEKLVITSNGFVLQDKLTPANSSVSSITNGKIFFDDDYIYVKIANNEIKRVELSSF